MILQQRQADILTLGNTKSIGVTFDESKVQKLMYILTTSLYSNPIGSIVREYTSNCFDAHAEIGNKTDAVIVQIDNNMIRFTDFGAGMSQDKFESIFCKILNSSKENTNDAIGCWGLGSKSAFAYVDSFTVVSRHQGVQRTWSLSKTAHNSITADVISTRSTTEPSGTTVNIPIKSGDKDKFIQEAKRQLRYFDNVYHDYEGAPTNIKLFKSKHIIVSNQQMPYATNEWGRSTMDSELTICLGQVNYPIDWAALNIRKISVNMALYFPIGELNVTPSREGILWDDLSKSKVLDKLQLSREYLKNKYIKEATNTADPLKYRLQKDNPAILDLCGQKINVNYFAGTTYRGPDHIPNLRYVGKLDLTKMGGYQMMHRENTKQAVKAYHTGSISFRKDMFALSSVDLSRTKFYKKFNRNKALFEYKNNDIKYFIGINGEYAKVVEPWVSKEYGGWLDDVVIPKSVSTVDGYVHTRKSRYPARAKDEIVVSVARVAAAGKNYMTFDKRYVSKDQIINEFPQSDKYFIGTPKDTVELEKAFMLGFEVLQVAQSNLKYFSKLHNVSPIHTLDTTVKDMVSMYANTQRLHSCEDAYIIFSLAYHAINNRHINGLISSKDVAYMESILHDSYIHYKRFRSEKYGYNQSFAFQCLKELKAKYNVKYDSKIDKMVSKYKHLTNAIHIDCKFRYESRKGYLTRMKRYTLSNEPAWKFFKEYVNLYNKCK